MVAFALQWQSRVDPPEIIWLVKVKIFTVWLSTEKVHSPYSNLISFHCGERKIVCLLKVREQQMNTYRVNCDYGIL